MQKVKTVLLSVAAAISYGILHDQVTARLCIEYFTVAHPPLFHTESPTLLAFCWGVAATFWVGLVLGVLLALISQAGSLPPVPVIRLGKGIFVLLTTMAVGATAAGTLGYLLARGGIISVPEALATDIPAVRHHQFIAVWFAHIASYLFGIFGAAFWMIRIWRERSKPQILSLWPKTPLSIFRALLLVAVVGLIVYLRFAH